MQRYVNAKAESVREQVEDRAKPKKPLTVEMDELWSFVDEKDNEQWVWLALDAATREIVGGTTNLSRIYPAERVCGGIIPPQISHLIIRIFH